MALWSRCAWTTPTALPACPAEAAIQESKNNESRFRIDPAASPMAENRRLEGLPPGASNRNGGRDHLGILGEIKSDPPGEIVGMGGPAYFAEPTAIKRDEIAAHELLAGRDAARAIPSGGGARAFRPLEGCREPI